MAEFTLVHERHPHHISAMATGIALHGPLGDGFVMMTFHRDAARLVKEVFDSVEEDLPGGTALRLMGRTQPPEVAFYREDVASLLIPADKFAQFAEAVQTMANSLTTVTVAKQD
jgi:hypothetical protein